MNTGRIIISALAASILAIPAMAEDAPGYFKVPGTETTMKVYGKAETWAWYNMDQSTDMDLTTVPVTPAHDQSWKETGTVDSVTYGRFGFTTITPSTYGDVNVKVEVEAKTTANEGETSWGSPFRIRHAYGEFAGLLIGQTNSLFLDWQYCPGYNDTWHADFNEAQYRTRQIRYTFTPTKEIKVAISVEQDKSGGNSTKIGQSIVGAFQYAADWGSVQAAVDYQKKRDWANDANAGIVGPVHNTVSASGTGTSFTVGGSWNITPNDTLGLRVIKGGSQGGNSVYGIPDGFYPKDNGYSFYTSTSVDLGYAHTWNDAFTSNIGIGQIIFPKDTDAGHYDKVTVTEFFVNTNWNITKNCVFGAEYFDSAAKQADYNEILKVDGTYTNKLHNNGFNLKFTYNFF